MYQLPYRNKQTLIKKIRHYKQICFPGRGSGIRLAEEIGTTPQTISNWLSGNRMPTIQQMYRLAKAFGVSPIELCGMKKRTSNAKRSHISVLVKLLQYCERNIVSSAKIQKTNKFLKTINIIVEKELCDQ